MKEKKEFERRKISTQPFPRSQKIMVKGMLHDINVAMREIETDELQSNANSHIKSEKNKNHCL